jgi:3-methyladenine DNA glycosylase/8-oxoguanine DNA glycosylase
LETLAGVPERVLRDMSFGYRAKYIPTAAQQVLDKDDPGTLPL